MEKYYIEEMYKRAKEFVEAYEKEGIGANRTQEAASNLDNIAEVLVIQNDEEEEPTPGKD